MEILTADYRKISINCHCTSEVTRVLAWLLFRHWDTLSNSLLSAFTSADYYFALAGALPLLFFAFAIGRLLPCLWLNA